MNLHAADGWHPGLRESATFDRNSIAEIQRAAREGLYAIRGFGAKRRVPHFDDLLLLGASVSRYPLEGYRERCDTDVTIGTRFAREPIHLQIPITIAGMSFGALSGAGEGSARTRRDRGRHQHDDGRWRNDPRGAGAFANPRLPVAPFAVRNEPGRSAPGRRDRSGRRTGAKPGGGGMLLGHKVSDRVAEMRDLPTGIDQRSACRHPDWTGPDDLEIKLHELREITDWRIPIYVKIGATRTYFDVTLAVKAGRRRDRARRDAGRDSRHPGGVHRARRHPDPAGDSARGRGAPGPRHASRGAADRLGRDPNRGRCRQGARAGGRRGLDRRRGADRAGRQRSRTTTTSTASIGSAAGYYDDYQAGLDPAGISTQDPELAARFDPVRGGRRLANYLRTLVLETQTLARACGKSHVLNLEPEDLVALTIEAAAMARVPLGRHELDPGDMNRRCGVRDLGGCAEGAVLYAPHID